MDKRWSRDGSGMDMRWSREETQVDQEWIRCGARMEIGMDQNG